MGKLPDNSQQTDAQNHWHLLIFEGADKSCPYETFRNSLDPYRQIVLDICVEEILAKQGNNVCNSSWGKALGQGLFEFRINRSLSAICHQAGIELPEISRRDSKVLLRVFFTVEGNRIVLLLSGYDKGKDVSRKKQQRLISQARALLAAHKTVVDK